MTHRTSVRKNLHLPKGISLLVGKKEDFTEILGVGLGFIMILLLVNITLLVNIMQVPDKRRNAGDFLVTVKLHFPLTLFFGLMNAE